MSVHRTDYKKNKGLGLDKNIVDNIDDWYIELYENFPCDKRYKLDKREGEVIKIIGTLNKNIVGRTKKEYYSDNIEWFKEYYVDNIERFKEYYIDDSEKLNKNYKKYYKKNIETFKQKYINNSEKRKQYYIDNAAKRKNIN